MTPEEKHRERSRAYAAKRRAEDPSYRRRSGEWASANPERMALHNANYHKRNPEKRRAWRIKRMFGVTIAQVEAMITAQGGCAICGTFLAFPAKTTHIDHCHETKKVRGILCELCNRGIGHFKDNTVVLHNAIKYIEFHRRTKP